MDVFHHLPCFWGLQLLFPFYTKATLANLCVLYFP